MNWYQKIWQPKKLIVVLLEIQQGRRSYKVIKLTSKDVRTNRIPESERFTSFEEVINHYGTNTPYAIHLFGTGILSRKVNYHSSYKNDLIVSGDVNEFVFTSYSDGQEIACSFFRKELVKDELTLIKNRKVFLFGVTSGLVPGFLLLENKSVNFDFHIGMQNGQISEFRKSEEPKQKIIWKDNYITQNSFVALAVFESLNTVNEGYTTTDLDQSLKSKDEYYQFSQFRTYGIATVSVILFSLTGNYFYQNSLNNSIAQLEMDLSLSNENLALLDRLDQEIIRKKQLLQSSGVSSRFISFFLDEIGESVPHGIKLKELNVFPIDGKLKNKKKVEVVQNKIELIGTTSGNIVLDDWIEKLNRNDWVRSVELINYLKDKDGFASFKFIIIIED